MKLQQIIMSSFKNVIDKTKPPTTPALNRVSPTLLRKWDLAQSEIRGEIIHHDTEAWASSTDLRGLNRVAGIDVSVHAKDHDAEECDAFAAVVICNFPSMEIIHEETQRVHLSVPYVPGYLAFRECEPVIELVQNIIENQPDKVPDALLVDGNGILHPYRCGLACHIGVRTAIPTMGVAKNLHLVEGVSITKQMVQGMTSTGDYTLIRDDSNEIIGMALKTASDTKNPIYLSIGHKLSLDTAKRVVLKCSKYRIPEPIRFADNISRELIRKTGEKSQSESQNKVK